MLRKCSLASERAVLFLLWTRYRHRNTVQQRRVFNCCSSVIIGAALTASDIAYLESCAPNNAGKQSVGPLEFCGPLKRSAPFRACIAVMDHSANIAGPGHDRCALERNNVSRALRITCSLRCFSQALLYCAGILLNQALDEDLDERQMAYTIVTDGRLWRFVVRSSSQCAVAGLVADALIVAIANHAFPQALQLNTLDFDAASSDPEAVKNAAWVYETELYTTSSKSGKLIVNPEPLEILMDILVAAEGGALS